MTETIRPRARRKVVALPVLVMLLGMAEADVRASFVQFTLPANADEVAESSSAATAGIDSTGHAFLLPARRRRAPGLARSANNKTSGSEPAVFIAGGTRMHRNRSPSQFAMPICRGRSLRSRQAPEPSRIAPNYRAERILPEQSPSAPLQRVKYRITMKFGRARRQRPK
jgi:hypothetical protein